MAWLDDHPPARDQFRCPRRERPSGVMCVHTAESTPDFVAFDGGAEAVANFIRNRSDAGSYHDLVDSDSCINLVSYSCEAYQDGTGSNPHAWGGSVATRADVWPLAPSEWRAGAIAQLAAAAARYAKWLKVHYGITVPARRINRAQSEARMPGFISHAERDPARRSDPGEGFPWDQFLSEYAARMGDGGFLMALDERYQREMYDDVSGEGRLKEVTLLVRGLAGVDPLEPADIAGGDVRATFKTLLQGALLDGLRERSDDRPDRGMLREPFKALLNEVLDEREAQSAPGG